MEIFFASKNSKTQELTTHLQDQRERLRRQLHRLPRCRAQGRTMVLLDGRQRTPPRLRIRQRRGQRRKKIGDIVRFPSYWPDTPVVRNDLLDYAYEVEHLDRQSGKVIEELKSPSPPSIRNAAPLSKRACPPSSRNKAILAFPARAISSTTIPTPVRNAACMSDS
jgi:hypothetical protein